MDDDISVSASVTAVAVVATMDQLGVSQFDVWAAYFLLGGNLSEFDIDAYLYGVASLPVIDESILSQAVWEMRWDHGLT